MSRKPVSAGQCSNFRVGNSLSTDRRRALATAIRRPGDNGEPKNGGGDDHALHFRPGMGASRSEPLCHEGHRAVEDVRPALRD